LLFKPTYMKNHKIRFVSLMFLLAVICFACEKDDPEWVQINAVDVDDNLAAELNSTFSEANDCLVLTGDKSQMKVLFSKENFQELDTCQTVPVIDFDSYTLIGGKINVTSTSDEIASINLSLLDNTYKVEVILDRCSDCDEPHGFLYFWEVFPKLEYGYNYEFLVK
jgi:hypothetical protein